MGAKINVTHNTRNINTGANEQKNVIWEPEEIKDFVKEKNETRPRPEFDCIFKQNVGSSDVYGMLSDMTPGSQHCQEILFKVKLPNTKLAEIQLDITADAAQIQTPQYFLHHIFPYQVNDKEGKAKWVSDLEELQISLPI